MRCRDGSLWAGMTTVRVKGDSLVSFFVVTVGWKEEDADDADEEEPHLLGSNHM